MAHVAKHTRAASGHMCAHYDRTAANISNENINPERTKENYNLAPAREISQNDFIKERCGAVQCMNRKDVNVMCSWLVTAPKDLPEKDNQRFFEESYKFMSTRYGGEKNVVSSYVHMDEITPHMHFAFVPVVVDGRKGIEKVSAKELVNRADLRSFHEDLENHLAKAFGRELGILNEATKEGNKSIAELKRGQAVVDLENAQSELAEVRNNIKHLQATEKGLQGKVEGLQGQVLTVKGLEAIQPEKTITGAVKGVSVEQVRDLKKTAVKYHEVVGQNKQLSRNYDELKQEYARVKRQVPTMKERLEQSKSQQNIRDLKNKLQKAYDFIDRIPEDVRQRMEQEIRQEQKQARQKRGRDMEL